MVTCHREAPREKLDCFQNLNRGVKKRGETVQRLRGKDPQCGVVQGLEICAAGAESLLRRTNEKES